MPVFVVLLVVGLATLGILGVLLVGLIRHLKLLLASLRRFQDEIQPVLEDIQRGAAEAQDRLERLSERSASEKPGARLRQ